MGATGAKIMRKNKQPMARERGGSIWLEWEITKTFRIGQRFSSVSRDQTCLEDVFQHRWLDPTPGFLIQ